MQETVNIKEYLDIFKRRKWIIIIVILLSLAFGGYITYKNYNSYVPTYTSNVTVRINTMKEYEAELEKENQKLKEIVMIAVVITQVVKLVMQNQI